MNRRIKSLILTVVAGLAVSACIKDEGNYDYTTELGAVIISNDMSRNPEISNAPGYQFKVGEEIILNPVYEIKDEQLTKEELQFEWYLGNELVGTEEVLKLKDYPAKDYTGIFVVIDSRYDTRYAHKFTFSVNAEFDKAYWGLMTRQEDASYLSSLSINSKDKSYVYEKDIFGSVNKGMKLSGDIQSFTTHFYNNEPPHLFTFNIVQNNDLGPIEVNVKNMEIEGKVYNEFVSGKPNCKFKDVAYLSSGTWALTEEGETYTKNDKYLDWYMVPHTGYFGNSPVTVSGGMKLSHWINTAYVSTDMTADWMEWIIAYDEQNKRLVELKSHLQSESTADIKVYPFNESFYADEDEPHRGGPGWDGKNTYNDITFPEPSDLSEYQVIALNGAGCNVVDNTFQTPIMSVAMVLEKAGKYYFYSFRFRDYYAPAFFPIDVNLDLFFPLEVEGLDPSQLIIKDYIGGPYNRLFFTSKGSKNLYMLNVIKGNPETGQPKVVYTANSPITTFGAGEIGTYGRPGLYSEQMVVGTEDEMIHVIKLDDQALANGRAQVLYEFKSELGPLTHVVWNPNDTQLR